MDTRESWDSYFVKLALMVASRSTCGGSSGARKVGAVLVQGKSVRGTGYNGAPSGHPSCLEVGCLEDEHGRCERAVHAEQNILVQADSSDWDGATVYCTDMCCRRCAVQLANTGISEFVYLRPFDRDSSRSSAILALSGIDLRQYSPRRPQDLPAFGDWTDEHRGLWL
jgi:dCMP deaminase